MKIKYLMAGLLLQSAANPLSSPPDFTQKPNWSLIRKQQGQFYKSMREWPGKTGKPFKSQQNCILPSDTQIQPSQWGGQAGAITRNLPFNAVSILP